MFIHEVLQNASVTPDAHAPWEVFPAREHVSKWCPPMEQDTEEEMTMKPWTKWQDWGTLVLGVLLFVAPWLLGTATNAGSSWNAWIVGIVFVVLSLLALARPHASEYEWIILVAGAWLFFAPWFLGFAAVGAAAWTAWIIGILTVALAVWKLQEVHSLQAQTTAF